MGLLKMLSKLYKFLSKLSLKDRYCICERSGNIEFKLIRFSNQHLRAGVNWKVNKITFSGHWKKKKNSLLKIH